MQNTNDEMGSVDFTIPFAQQPNIQAFLGYPTPQEGTTVSSDLLHRFLQLAEYLLSQRVQAPFESRQSPISLKLGYERKVALDDKGSDYKIESHFVSNQSWKRDYDHIIYTQSLARFVDDMPDKIVDETEGFQALPELFLLNEAIADELYRTYPQLEVCLDIHVYLFVNIESAFLNDSNSFTENLILLAATNCNCDPSPRDASDKKTRRWNIRSSPSTCTDDC
jgi:hypothetical protein